MSDADPQSSIAHDALNDRTKCQDHPSTFCTREQRLKVRYSQLCDLSYYTPVQIDPFVRWFLSDPITKTKAIAEAAERPTSSAGDTAAQLTAFDATESPSTTRCYEDFPNGFAAISTMASIATN
jgi:hypothetical protein